MGQVPSTGEEEVIPNLPWLPGERSEITLDARLGCVTPPSGGPQALMVTSQRAILFNHKPGNKTTSLLPLARLISVEVVDVSRSRARLVQGLLLLGTGLVLGIGIWTVLEVRLFVLVAGGVPALVGVYLLSAYLFPSEKSGLLLHSGGHAPSDGGTLRMPLLSDNAQRDAYLVAHRLSELVAALPPNSTGQTPQASTPEAAIPLEPQPAEPPVAEEETVVTPAPTAPVETAGEAPPLPQPSAGEVPADTSERGPAT